MRRVLISTKPFIFVLFPVGVTVRSAESLSSAIPLGTSTKRANSKRANHGQSRLFQDAVSSVSFGLRSFSVCGWRTRSLSSVSGRPEAARPPPPSSLPSMVEWPGGTRAFPRWREQSRCTCAHETPPLGGTVSFSRPRPVSWQPLSRPKLTVLRARQPPPCTPWLSCRFTKPRRSNRCTRVVPTRGWCRSCARRLTSLYERQKLRCGPSGRRCPPWWSRSAISGSTWQRWRTSTRHAFSTPPSPREGCSATLSRASPSSSRRYSSRPRRSSTSCPGVMHHPPLPPGPGLSLPVAVGAHLRPPEPLRPRPNRHVGRRVEPLAGERRPPRPSQAPSRPGSRRSGPDVGNPEMLEFALSQETARTAPLLPPVEGREENLLFRFVSVPPLVQGPAVPTFSKKEQFPFPPGSQVHGTTVCDALPPHSRPRPILPVAKIVRFGDDIPPHAPLASPVRDPGSSVRMPQNAPLSVPSTPTPFRCTTTGTSIVPLEPLAQRLEAWLTLPSLAGSRAQFDSATRFSSPGDLPSSTAFSRRRWQSGTPLSCARRLLSSWQRMQSSRSLQPRWGRGFTALTSSYPRKVVAFGQSWICESWTGLYTSSSSRCWRTGAWSNAFSPRIGLQRSTWRTLTFTFRSFRDTDRFYGLRSNVGHGSTGSSPSGSPCLPVCSRRL